MNIKEIEEIKKNIECKNFRFKENNDFSNNHVTCDIFYKNTFISDFNYNLLSRYCEAKKSLQFKFGFTLNKKGYDYKIESPHYYGGVNPEKVYKGSNSDIFIKSVLLKAVNSKYKEEFYPKLDDVLYCLISDLSCLSNSVDFEDFCFNFGYEEDSRKAYSIFNKLKDNFVVMYQLFDSNIIEQLKKHYEEY